MVVLLMVGLLVATPTATAQVPAEVGRSFCMVLGLTCVTVLLLEQDAPFEPAPRDERGREETIRVTYEYESTAWFLAAGDTEVVLRLQAEAPPLVVEPEELRWSFPITQEPGATGVRSVHADAAFTVRCAPVEAQPGDAGDAGQGSPRAATSDAATDASDTVRLRFEAQAMDNGGYDGTLTTYEVALTCADADDRAGSPRAMDPARRGAVREEGAVAEGGARALGTEAAPQERVGQGWLGVPGAEVPALAVASVAAALVTARAGGMGAGALRRRRL